MLYHLHFKYWVPKLLRTKAHFKKDFSRWFRGIILLDFWKFLEDRNLKNIIENLNLSFYFSEEEEEEQEGDDEEVEDSSNKDEL